MEIKVDIISGFLGAGKTMLIKKLISEKLCNEKIVIIENEFGQVAIDGTILKKSNIEVKEINAGCICCSVTGNFNDSIKEIIEKYSPERIIIEPSGVAKLSEILDICKKHEFKDMLHINMIITMVDALRFNMYIKNFSDFYKNQIFNGKTIILTRTDKFSCHDLSKIIKKIKEINSNAPIVTTNLIDLTANQIIEIAENSLDFSLVKDFTLLKTPVNNIVTKHKNKSLANDNFESFGLETPKSFSKEALNVILNNLDKDTNYGTILRAKGIVKSENNNWIHFEYVPKELSITDTTPDYTSRICIIGTNLNKVELKNLFLS